VLFADVYTKQIGLEVMLSAGIHEVLGLNLHQDTGYPDLRLLWFSSVPPGKCWGSTSIRPQLLPSRSFPLHLSSHHLILLSRVK
jgi:hypothetical protein